MDSSKNDNRSILHQIKLIIPRDNVGSIAGYIDTMNSDLTGLSVNSVPIQQILIASSNSIKYLQEKIMQKK